MQCIKAIVIGCEKYYRRTFSDVLQGQIVFYDHIGFREDDTGYCSLDLILKEINVLQDNLLLDKVVIIGHSIHAYISAEYAKIYPDKVTKVILIGSGPYTDIQAANSYFNEYADSKRKNALEQNLTLPFGYFSNDPFIDRMLRFAPMLWYNYNYDATTLWDGIKFNYNAVNITWGDMFKDYKIEGLIQPTLVMIGRYDFFNPPFLWKNTQDIVLFERSAHTPQFEEQEKFNREFLRFIYEKV